MRTISMLLAVFLIHAPSDHTIWKQAYRCKIYMPILLLSAWSESPSPFREDYPPADCQPSDQDTDPDGSVTEPHGAKEVPAEPKDDDDGGYTELG